MNRYIHKVINMIIWAVGLLPAGVLFAAEVSKKTVAKTIPITPVQAPPSGGLLEWLGYFFQFEHNNTQTTIILFFVLMLVVATYIVLRVNRKLDSTKADLEKDIVERKQIEDRLIISEEKYRSLMDNLPIGVYRNNPGEEGKFIEVNNAILKIFGYTDKEEAYEGKVSDIYQNPAERKLLSDKLIKNGYVKNEEMKFKRKDDTPIYCSVTSKAIYGSNGNIDYFDGIIQDITDRKKAEEELRKLSYAMQQSSTMVIITDLNGNIEYVNPKFLAVTGYTMNEVLGENSRILKSGETALDVYRDFWNTISNSREWRGEFHNRKKDGNKFWVSASASAIKNSEGKITHYLAIQEDITLHKQEEQELRDAKKAAEDANRTKSEFLAKMSHELRTPLNAIIGYSEMLEEEAEDLNRKEFIPDLEKIRSAGKHLLSLINDILDLSKIEAGKMVLYLETFDIRPMIQDIVATAKPLVEKNENKIILKCPMDMGIMRADMTKVRQVLFNLISNSCKFTEKGTITVDVGYEVKEGERWILIAVEDTGIGMTPDQVGNLFKEFIQGDSSTTRKYGGTGLGLAISKRFCEMMNGDITVTSEFGKGSRFLVHLPAEVISETAEAKPKITKTPLPTITLPSIASDSSKNLVLVIDDDLEQLELMKRFLQKEGFNVDTASNGAEGLEKARNIIPMAITLDVMMPKMDGWSVLTALKSQKELENIPVIMVTMIDDKSMGYALGVTDYMTKPVDKEHLLRVLNKYQNGPYPNPILVIEDDEASRELVVRLLEKEKCEIITAENGKMALEKMKIKKPGMILLDLMMPEMDGFEFITELRKNPEWRIIPVVVITSKDLTQEEYQYLSGNVKRIFQKGGYKSEELLKELKEQVNMISNSQFNKSGT